MVEPLWLSLQIYALAILISLGVALVVKAIVLALRVRRRQPGAVQAAQANPASEPPPQHLAAIAAALAQVLGEHRIVHIAGRPHAEGWAQEGRAAHHQSHNIPRHRKP